MGGTNGALYTGDIDYVGLTYASDPTFWAIPIQRKLASFSRVVDLFCLFFDDFVPYGWNNTSSSAEITVNGQEAAAGSNSSALAAIDTATSLSEWIDLAAVGAV